MEQLDIFGRATKLPEPERVRGVEPPRPSRDREPADRTANVVPLGLARQRRGLAR